MSAAPRRRTALVWACAAAALLALVCVRVLVEGARELAAGQRALDRADYPEGIRRLRRAAHWYLPGSPYTARAYDALERVAQQAEAQGRADHALAAWRAIRASALATRWLVVPERPRLARANRHIAALMSEQPQPPEDRDTPRARLQEEHLALLSADHAPEPAWVLVMALGFALWLGAAVWATRHGWDEHDRVRARALVLAGAVLASGLLLFVLGISRA
jgi:hypothetical protein